MPSSYIQSGEATSIDNITGLGTGIVAGDLARPIFATTATAAGTTTLTVASASTQEFTGSTTQTVTMPAPAGLVLGWSTTFINKSTGSVTLNAANASASIIVLAGGQSVTLVCKNLGGGAVAAAWDVVGTSPELWFASAGSGTVALTDNVETTLTFSTATGGNITGWFDGTTITAGLAGYLTFEGVIGINADASGDTSANDVDMGISKNGTTYKIYNASTQFMRWDSSDTTFYLPFTYTVACAVGNTFLVRVKYSDGGTGTVALAARTLKVTYNA